MRGVMAGQILTIRLCTKDEIYLLERSRCEVMSKLNVEPVEPEPPNETAKEVS